MPQADEAEYAEYRIDWHHQTLLIRHCPSWLCQETDELEIISPDRVPHPLLAANTQGNSADLPELLAQAV